MSVSTYRRVYFVNRSIVISSLLFLLVDCERSVPADTDICSRLPTASVCPKSTGQNQPPQTANAGGGNPGAGNGPGAGTGGAAPPPAAAAAAGANPAAAPNSQSPEVAKLCQQYSDLAHQYCVGPPNELPLAKQKCDYWRQYCKDFDQQATQSPFGAPPCAPYEVQYLTLCVQQQPVNDEIGRFCYAYRHACVYGRKPQTLNPGFNAPVGRPLVAPGSSTVVDPYWAPWSSIYTHDQRNATLLKNGPLPALPNMPLPWSNANVPGLDKTPIGAVPVNQALINGAPPQFAPAPVVPAPAPEAAPAPNPGGGGNAPPPAPQPSPAPASPGGIGGLVPSIGVLGGLGRRRKRQFTFESIIMGRRVYI